MVLTAYYRDSRVLIFEDIGYFISEKLAAVFNVLQNSRIPFLELSTLFADSQQNGEKIKLGLMTYDQP